MAGSQADRGCGDDVTVTVEPADANVSLALQHAFFADIASRYPGWVPAGSSAW